MSNEDNPKSFEDAARIVETLVESRRLLKDTLSTKRVTESLRLFRQAITGSEDNERLRAVSILGKAAEVSKPVSLAVQPILAEGLRNELPPLDGWGGAEDRYYLAKGVSAATESWTIKYAAKELAQAEVAERSSRAVWAEIALGRGSSLSEVVEVVARALAEQPNAPETTSRKLIRICEALSTPLVTADIPCGERFGTSFADLIVQASGLKGTTANRLREETGNTVLDLMIRLARLRFEVLLDADFYRAAGIVRGWWKPAVPPSSIETRSDRLAQLAFSGLQILARQGITDDRLRQTLSSSLGAQRVNDAGAAIAASDPSLNPNISRWISSGQALSERQSSETIRDDQERSLDEVLAKLLVAIDNQDSGAQSIESIADSIEILEPTNASILRQAAGRLRLIEQWGRTLATRRYVALSGDRGQVVRFDPALHQANEPIARSASVRIAMPGVIRRLPGRPEEIVLKATVEQLEGTGE